MDDFFLMRQKAFKHYVITITESNEPLTLFICEKNYMKSIRILAKSRFQTYLPFSNSLFCQKTL